MTANINRSQTEHSLTRYVPALDGIRALAIAWVFSFHALAFLRGRPFGAPGGWTGLGEKGLLGVELFFVLSGFLLVQPWLRAHLHGLPRPSALVFYRRRAARILPAYYVHVAVLFLVVLPLLYGGFAILGSDWGLLNLAAHGVMAQFLHPGSASGMGLNMALWSMSLEVEFYLLLPLLAPLFLGRRAWVALAVALALSLCWRTFAPDILMPWLQRTVPPALLVYVEPLTGQIIPYPPLVLRLFVERQIPGEFLAFAVGMALANVYLRFPSLPRRDARWIASAAMIALVVGGLAWLADMPGMSLFGSWWRYLGMPAFLLASGLLVLAAAQGIPLIGTVLKAPPLVWLGLISYSLYLWHEPLLRLAYVYLAEVPLAWVRGPEAFLAASIGSALLVASLSFRLLERPRRVRGAVPAAQAQRQNPQIAESA